MMSALPPSPVLIRGYGADWDNLRQVISAYKNYMHDAEEYISQQPPDNARHQEALKTAQRIKSEWFKDNPDTQTLWINEMTR